MRTRLTVLIAVMVVALATPAAAYCTRASVANVFDDALQTELKYLVCLHNEQVDQINALSADTTALTTTASEMMDTIARLQVQLADIEDRLQALERQR